MKATTGLTVGVIGAGALAGVLVPLLADSGYRVTTVASRRIAAARRLARRLAGCRATTRPASAAQGAQLLLLAVPDRAIEIVARELSDTADVDWATRTALHHAGALGLEPLAPLARRGCATAVLHPLQSLGRPEIARRTLPGSAARVEGRGRGRTVARRLARDLRLRVLPLPDRLTAPQRGAYHAAASMAANDLVGLLDLAGKPLVRAGLSREDARRALAPLVRGTLELVEALGTEGALTGPVVRGDVATLEAQLRSLRKISRAAAETHRQLSQHLVELATRAGRIAGPERQRLLRALRPHAGGRVRRRTV